MNAHEFMARQRKLDALLARVPAGNNAAIAAHLAAFTAAERAAWAAGCGTRKPSAETWRQFCEAVRARTEAA